MEEVYLVNKIILGITILSSIFCIINFRKFSKPNKVYSYMIIFGTAIEIISTNWAYLGKNNLIFLHLNTLMEFIVATLFFNEILDSNKTKWVKHVLIFGILIILLNSIFIQKIDTYNSYSLTLVSIYLILCSFNYLYKAIDNLKNDIQLKLTNYIVYLILIIHSTSIIIWLLSNHLLQLDSNYQYVIWAARGIIILIIKFILLYLLGKILFLNTEKNYNG